MANLAASAAEPPATRLAALDGLRGIAALVVLLFHLEQHHGIHSTFAFGYLAVDFFFLLSGFVLVGPIERRLAERRTSGARIFVARILRFLPLIALGAAIGAAVHLLRWPVSQVLPLLVLAWLNIPLGWGGANGFSLNAPQWSMFVELVCNALHVVLLRHLKVPALLALSLTCGIGLAWSGRQLGSLALGTGFDDILLGLLRAGFAYPLGIVIGRKQHLLGAIPLAAGWLAPAVLFAAIVAPALLGMTEMMAESVVSGLFVVVLVVGARTRITQKSAQTLAWLGAISFPLYAVHFPILEWADMLGRGAPPALRPEIFLGGLIVALGLAHMLSRTRLAQGISLGRWRAPRSNRADTLARSG